MWVTRNNRVRRQDGVALITMLLIIAVLTAIVSRLSLSNEVWIRQVENGAGLAEARQANRAALFWTRMLLEKDDPEYDAFTDDWAQPVAALPLGRGTVDGRVTDLQARFNLNNLVDADGRANALARDNFARLLQALEIEPGIAEAAVDWLDADDRPIGPWGAEDGYYLGMDPPYLPANRKMSEVAELRLVRGVTGGIWRRLAPHVTALPVTTDINVNTATAPVLAAMMTNWGAPRNALGAAERWLRKSRVSPARELETFAREALGGEMEELPAGLGVGSGHFMAHIRLTFGRVDYHSATLYQRDGKRADVIWQSREFY